MSAGESQWQGRPPSRVRRAIRRTITIAALLVCLILGLALVTIFGVQTGLVATLLGLALATVPVPLYVALILWIDRFEAEPPALLGLSFFLGATVSVFTAAVLNTVIAGRLGDDPALAGWVVASGPVVEEAAKGAVVLGLYWWRRDEFDGVIDGIVYAGMVGLGFAMVENIQYYGDAALVGGLDRGTRLFILRGLMAPFAHPLFTALTGIGLGLARMARARWQRLAAAALGMALATGVHALWNLSVLHGAASFRWTYLCVMVPMFVLGLIAVALELRREGRAIGEHLRAELDAGVLGREELARLISVSGRMAAQWQALRRGGRIARRRTQALQQVVAELALHRQRIARGTVAADAEQAAREAAYRAELATLLRATRAAKE